MEAKRTPNGYVYAVDEEFRLKESVPSENIIGWWKVNSEGIIEGEFEFSEKHWAFKDGRNKMILDKDFTYTSIFLFSISVSTIFYGVYMIREKVVAIGSHRLTQQYTAAGGEYYIFMGIIVLIIWYLSLPHFSRIKRFFKRK